MITIKLKIDGEIEEFEFYPSVFVEDEIDSFIQMYQEEGHIVEIIN